MPFFEFQQNNSGGSFVHEDRKLSHFVIVEAPSLPVASAMAEDLGVYYNGCDTGQDCSCCGDRWTEPYDEEGKDEPEHYSTGILEKNEVFIPAEDAEDAAPSYSLRPMKWMDRDPEGYVHYLDGRVRAIDLDSEGVLRFLD